MMLHGEYDRRCGYVCGSFSSFVKEGEGWVDAGVCCANVFLFFFVLFFCYCPFRWYSVLPWLVQGFEARLSWFDVLLIIPFLFQLKLQF